jgi:hypothetical protein
LDKVESNFEFELFFMPPQNPESLVFDPKQEPLYVPIEHDKIVVRRGHMMLHLHMKIINELLNPTPFFT